jgi:hypothetical protein
MRTAFLKMTTGIVKTLKSVLRQLDKRNICPARMLVMNRAELERMPLHSAAISISTPGSKNLKCRHKTGTPKSLNKP